MKMSLLYKCMALAMLVFFMTGSSLAETWQNAQLLNTPSETSAKSSRVFGAKNGGFHTTYLAGGLKYRRYQNGSFTNPLTVATGVIYNVQISEAFNNDIHIVWEDWSYSGIPVGYAISTNGGISFSRTNIPHNNTKYPYIAPYGTGTSATMLLTAGSINYPNVSNNNMNYATYNGSLWTAMQHATAVPGEYNLEGICTSPIDNSVWKIYNGSDSKLYIRRFNGSSWDTPILIDNEQTFRSRQSVAVNIAGQIMCMWSKDSAMHFRIYTPGSGAGPKVDLGSKEDVGKCVAMPGRKEFYIAYIANGAAIKGRRYYSGILSPAVTMSNGLGGHSFYEVALSVDPNGNLYAVYEHWPSDSPQQYYSICTNFAVSDSTPPSAPPSVTDAGDRTDSTTDLHFTWASASDPQSGIERYEYSVGTSPGATNVRGWIYAGTGNEYTAYALPLSPGTTYYINVRAINGAGLEGPATSSNGILCDPTTNTVYFGNTLTLSTSSSSCEQVAMASASDGGMHLIYREGSANPYKAAYRKLTGSDWSSVVYPGGGSPSSYFPCVVESPTGSLHAIFCNPGGRESNDIYQCTNSGSGWSAATVITSGATMDWYPKLAKGAGSELAHYVVMGDNTTYNVKWSVRTSSGWSSPTIISGSYRAHRYGIPDIASDSNGNVYVVWTDSSYRVLFAKRTGGVWSAPVIVHAFSTGFIAHPRIDVGTDGLAHILCADHNVGPDPAIYYIRQTSPSAWNAPVLIGNGYYSAIAIDKTNKAHVVYGKGAGGNQEIYHKFFNGYAWSQEQNLSMNSGMSSYPSIRVDTAGDLHVAWQDNTSGTYRVLYRKTSEPPTCGSVKRLGDGTIIEMRSKVVTGIFTDESCIYVEEPDRTSGIRVSHSGSGLAIGDRVNVNGTLTTLKPGGTVSSERQIASATVTKVSPGVPLKPIAMLCKAVGGAADGSIPGVIEGDGKVGIGLNNIGLLVKISGKVTKVLGSYIYVDDGSGVLDILDGGAYRTGVMVRCATTPTVSVGNIVSVIGIVQGSIPSGWTASRRFIRCRTASDLIKIYP